MFFVFFIIPPIVNTNPDVIIAIRRPNFELINPENRAPKIAPTIVMDTWGLVVNI